MPKITKATGASNAGIVRTAFGGHVDAGLSERAAGFSDDIAATAQAAVDQEDNSPVTAPFDPSEWSVADVMAERENCTDEQWQAVLAAERAGKNRAGIR